MGYPHDNRLAHLLAGELNLEYNDAGDLDSLKRLDDGVRREASACLSPGLHVLCDHGPNPFLCLGLSLFPCHIDEK